ncbi:hypothetical protein BDF20DRAFT_838798 [Mycotypha africana]|uniref:uncharacterized protein n=1 Tax=Mycotypha africana TaxID=64632 RepID=UPI002301998D|nr:uncharacterized protein BDF20DRAFT_838798 [Mycotypha africana]KAI8970440.1 hypothetical protein BDF20DRAFT_838798 [Mycotypha africana]
MNHIAFALVFISLIVTVFAASAENAGIAITNPVINSTVPAGSNLTIEWTVLDANSSDIKFIRLMDGDSVALNTVIPNILENNNTILVNATRYTWAVPSNLTTRNDYVIAMLGDGPFATYSGYFSIVQETNNAGFICSKTNNTGLSS